MDKGSSPRPKTTNDKPSKSPDPVEANEPAAAPHRGAPQPAKPSKQAGTSEPNEDESPKLPHTFAPIGATSAAARACQSDADCTLSCYRDGRCCKELCGCSQVYNNTHAKLLADAVARNCSPDVRCPMAGCRGTKGGKAVCEAGQCVLEQAVPAESPMP